MDQTVVMNQIPQHTARNYSNLESQVLGLCYGAQLMQHVLGGKVEKAEVSEYGKTEVLIDKKDSKLFENVSEKQSVG